MRSSGRGDVHIREATINDLDRMIDLIRVCLGPGSVPRNREFFKWKHFSGPFGQSPGMVAEVNGHIVGLRLFLRWQFELADRVVKAVRPVDTATHPEWRRRGLFRALTTELVELVRDEGCEFAFNTPNEKSRDGYIKMGWQQLGRAPLLVRAMRPLRVVTVGLGGSSKLWPAATLEKYRKADEFLNEVQMPDEWLTEGTSVTHRLKTQRSVDYLRWRYSEIPGVEYRADCETAGGAFAAVLFRVRDRMSLHELSVAEIIVAGDRSSCDMASELLKRIASDVKPDCITACASRGTVERRILKKAGFLPLSRVAPWIVVRPLAGSLEGPDLTQKRSWQMSLGDLEVF
jgi:GNAT superfamily N-acetyltransferase